MSTIDAGGSAFPVNDANLGSAGYYPAGPGMSLRDYFAAQAITGLFSLEGLKTEHLLSVAACAYRLADAMIAESQRGRT